VLKLSWQKLSRERRERRVLQVFLRRSTLESGGPWLTVRSDSLRLILEYNIAASWCEEDTV
jgi:hypothetical protein